MPYRPMWTTSYLYICIYVYNIYLYIFYDILGVTGNALPADVDYFLDSGANAVLTKPVDTEKLKALFSLK
jgi:hypothetical protein